MKTNTKATALDLNAQKLAGGYGMTPAKQGNYELLRRAVLACLLGEDLHYESGESVKDNIRNLIPTVRPELVRDLAIEARNKQKLRHVPLFIAVEMLKYKEHRLLVSALIPEIVQRADEIAELLSLYWKERKTPIAKQLKKGLATVFNKFNEYQFAKYNRDYAIKLRDVMFLVHPKPENQEKAVLFKKLANNQLETPETWEVLYSKAKDSNEKRNVWIKLITEKKLGAMAFVRNLRNMVETRVPDEIIKLGFKQVNSEKLLPLNLYTASKVCPQYIRELEDLFIRSFTNVEKLPGKTVLVLDVSGSMDSGISSKSTNSRLDVAISLAILANEVCENIRIYATAGNDGTRIHATEIVPAYRGFGLVNAIGNMSNKVGAGGIFTRQCLEYVKEREENVDRIIIFSDSQDCDRDRSKLPQPFGKNNYIVDVSAHSKGINYKGVWTAEISGWSESFFDFILASEGVSLQEIE